MSKSNISFFKTDSRALRLTDPNEVLMHHYIARKVNITALEKGDELPKGQFRASLSHFAKEMGMTPTKVSRLLKKIEELEIITLVHKGKSKKDLTIYQYNTFMEQEEKPEVKKPKFEPQEIIPIEDGFDIFMDEADCEPIDINYNFDEGDTFFKIDMVAEYGFKIDISLLHQVDILKCMSAEQIHKCARLTQLNAKKDPLKYFFTTFANNYPDAPNIPVDLEGNVWVDKTVPVVSEQFETVEDIVEATSKFNESADMIEKTGQRCYNLALEGHITQIPSLRDLAIQYGKKHGLDVSMFDMEKAM